MSVRLPVFQAFAGVYDWLTSHDWWTDATLRLLDPWTGAPPRRVLDIGCGPGGSTFALARALGPGCEIVGIDLASEMIRRARRHQGELRRAGVAVDQIDFRIGDATRLDLADASFDAITGHSFLYLVRERAVALAELHRVLRPGGMLLLLEPTPGDGLVGAWRAGVDELPRSAPLPTRLGFVLTMASWRVASGAAGRLDPDTIAALFRAAKLEPLPCRPAFGGLALRAAARKPGPNAADRPDVADAGEAGRSGAAHA